MHLLEDEVKHIRKSLSNQMTQKADAFFLMALQFMSAVVILYAND